LTRRRFQSAGHILAELAQAIAPAARACRRRVDYHALAGKMLGERIALGVFARKCGDRRRPGDGFLRRQLVFGGAGFKLFEAERQLIDQARRAFRPLPIDLTLQFRDPKLLLRDQRHVFGRFRAGDRQLRFQGGVFSGKNGASGIHKTK
jgi:hypothetical protein